jgi:hypothetical protein
MAYPHLDAWVSRKQPTPVASLADMADEPLSCVICDRWVEGTDGDRLKDDRGRGVLSVRRSVTSHYDRRPASG